MPRSLELWAAKPLGTLYLVAHDVFWPVQSSVRGARPRVFPMEPEMKSKILSVVAGLVAAGLAGSASAQSDEKLGKLSFSISCDPLVQADFERGVAMLHSYWFNYARKTFEGILQKDPSCAMAYWGIAMDLLGNTLATTPSRAEAQAGWEALEMRAPQELRRSASATGSRPWAPTTGNTTRSRSMRALLHTTRRWSRWSSATPTTMRRAFSTPSPSKPPRPKPTRLMPIS